MSQITLGKIRSRAWHTRVEGQHVVQMSIETWRYIKDHFANHNAMVARLRELIKDWEGCDDYPLRPGYACAADKLTSLLKAKPATHAAVGVDANWIARHQIAAGDCPQQSEVILVSSLKRSLPAAVDVEAAQDD